ncbi:ABC transporter substrate-binding protein [Metasolibacillus meyeri]|uniref:ABC transporter substrate-binding protein n=1 Tax=Metasolibacillus meyeri TaxID=1071052 RepID=A0AAW9NRP4_9BACL|nr:ABC transporter substrate-binding protein [Metasolibacillus meyeri]MEC1176873.1 ABC transporter substrate-binding protein [Metasolibacillus meyeri]
MKRYRKQSLFIVMLVCALFVVAACNNKSDETTSTAKKEASNDTTRIVTDSVGREVEIPTTPQRVIVDWDLGHVLAVGVVPVATTTKVMGYGEFLVDYYKGQEIVDLGDEGAVSLETATNLKPDLIITYGEENVEQYEKIAPTIVFSAHVYDNVEAEITAMGEFLNHQEDAKNFIADYKARAQAAADKIKAVIPEGITFSLFTLSDKHISVIPGGTSGGEAMYNLLKLTAPASI